MNNKSELLSRLLSNPGDVLTNSINDLREKEIAGIKLSLEERTAINNFERYRLSILNSEIDEGDFHNKYRQLQVIANLNNWTVFLKEEFF